MQVPHNLYIHIPFCASKCNYCAFFSQACNAPDWDKYTDAIISEIKYWAQKMGRITIPTIFFGGGTPSLIPMGDFEKIMTEIHHNFNVAKNCEISLESNPGTLSDDKLNNFIKQGINRLSVGVQSLNDEKLKFLGRRHDAKTAIELIKCAQKKNIHVSGDFIYGLPGEVTGDIKQICRDINALGLQHCSMYELTIEKNTVFAKMNLQMPDNDEMCNMYNEISNHLSLPRYEVSNYSAQGFECAHNQNIWDGAPYIGLGRAAAGRILIDEQWWEQMGGSEKFEKISHHDRASEQIIMGLRQTRGIQADKNIIKHIDMDFIHNNPQLITINNNRIAATEKGMLILDNLLLNLIK